MAALTKTELLGYELNASRWWVGFIGNRWLQHRVAAYFAWKVNRKYAAHQRGLVIKGTNRAAREILWEAF